MQINKEVMDQFKEARSNYFDAKQKYDEMLKQIGLPVPEEIDGTTAIGFSTVESIELICEKPVSQTDYNGCGGYYRYYMVVTDTSIFFVVSGCAFDRKGGGEDLRFEPSMTTESRRAYLQYMVDNFETNKNIEDIYDDPEYYLNELITEEEYEERQAQISEVFERIEPLYEQISQHLSYNWSVKDYRPIAGNDMEVREAIQKDDIGKFIINWNIISVALLQNGNIDRGVVQSVSDLSEELKKLI